MAIWGAEINEIEKLLESLRNQLPELEKELAQMIRTDDPNVLMLYSRRCLEVVITDLCERELQRPRKTEPLKGIIDKLNKEEKVPSHIVTSMDGLNSLSTYGAHPKNFDPEQVKPALSNLAIIIKWYLRYKGLQPPGGIKSDSIEYVDQQTAAFVGEPRKPDRNRYLIFAGIILIIVVVVVFPKIFKRDRLENLRSSDGKISVLVLPFQNLTNDTIWDIWQDGIQDNLITSLSNSEELKVRQTASVAGLLRSKGYTNYTSITPSVASTISQKLDASVFIYGSIKKADTIIRINAQLIDSKTEDVFRSFQIDGSYRNILNIIDSLSRLVKSFLIISGIEKELSIDYKGLASTTNSPEAYRYFIYGQKAFTSGDNNTAIKMFTQALAIDSNFISSTIMLPFAYRNQGLYDDAKKWCLIAYRKRDQMSMWNKIFTNYIYAIFFETLNDAMNYDRQLLELDDQSPINYYGLCVNYNRLHQYDKAIPNGEKALEIYNKWDSKPEAVWPYTALGFAYHKTGLYKKEKKLYEKAEQNFPDNPELISRQAVLSFTEGDATEGNKYIDMYISVCRDASVPEANIITSLAGIYSEADMTVKAEECYREALRLELKKPVRLNNLAWFLIDNDLNIPEGLKLIDTALEINPNNYLFLHTKGWGLYKQGKFEDALYILEKSWDLRPFYNHELYLHLDEVRNAFASK